MKPLPKTEHPIVLRTDHSDAKAWDELRAQLETPNGQFRAYATYVDDPDYANLTTEQLLAGLEDSFNHSFLFVVDSEAISNPEHPILVLDLWDEPGKTFRAVPRAVQVIENNLSIANMDFDDFADTVDADGVYRDG